MTNPTKLRPPEGREAGAATDEPGRVPSVTQADDDVERALADVRRFEFAARSIADNESVSITARCDALLTLMSRARRSEAPGLMESGVWRGCRHFFYPEPEPPHDVIAANHRLIRNGHTACPECRRPLPSIAELNRWRQLGHEMHTRRSA